MVIGVDTTGSYFVVKKKAVPDVLLKVVEAKRLLETGKAASIHEAAEKMGAVMEQMMKIRNDKRQHRSGQHPLRCGVRF